MMHDHGWPAQGAVATIGFWLLTVLIERMLDYVRTERRTSEEPQRQSGFEQWWHAIQPGTFRLVPLPGALCRAFPVAQQSRRSIHQPELQRRSSAAQQRQRQADLDGERPDQR